MRRQAPAQADFSFVMKAVQSEVLPGSHLRRPPAPAGLDAAEPPGALKYSDHLSGQVSVDTVLFVALELIETCSVDSLGMCSAGHVS